MNNQDNESGKNEKKTELTPKQKKIVKEELKKARERKQRKKLKTTELFFDPNNVPKNHFEEIKPNCSEKKFESKVIDLCIDLNKDQDVNDFLKNL